MQKWRQWRKTRQDATTTRSSGDSTSSETSEAQEPTKGKNRLSEPVASKTRPPPIPIAPHALTSLPNSPAKKTPNLQLKRSFPDGKDFVFTDQIEVGITSVLLHHATQVVCYEISLRHVKTSQFTKIWRSFAEFLALHQALEGQFAASLHDRKIRFPRLLSRLSWRRIRGGDSEANLTAQHKQTMEKLNVYLHKLLELHEIYSSQVFREFFRTKSSDMEFRLARKQQQKVNRNSEPNALHSKPPLAIQSKRTVNLDDDNDDLDEDESQEEESCGQIDFAAADAVEVPMLRLPPGLAKSLCSTPICFGQAVHLLACGGLRIGLTKRSGLSKSEKAVAVAAGVAGVALTGPISAVLAVGALGTGKYQFNKTFFLKLQKPLIMNGCNASASQSHDVFLLENAEQFSAAQKPLKVGDLLRLHAKTVKKNVKFAPVADSKRAFCMVTNAESNDTVLLRLVSPFGHESGTPLVCGSRVMIQIMTGEYANQFVAVHEESLVASPCGSILKICLQNHQCFASEEIIPITRSIVREHFDLRVMVYNIWMLPGLLQSIAKVSPNTIQRAQAIPLCLARLNLDVVVFCESFCSTSRAILIEGMKQQGFLFETKTVGSGASVTNKKAMDGGVFAMSRYPIEHFDELAFGSIAVGDDRVADKGVIYFQMRVHDNTRVHVFGTHLQAWDSPAAISTRKNQLKRLRNFVVSKKISGDDAVLFVGDLNIDRFVDEVSEEYYEMLVALQAEDPPMKHKALRQYSFDPSTNSLAVDGPSSGGKQEHLDYVLFAKLYRQPKEAYTQIVPLKASKEWLPLAEDDKDIKPKDQQQDLSDHYPVMAHFRF